MSYIFFAFLSSFFAAVTSILAKIGIKDVNSHLATAIRTVVVLVFSWLMVFITSDISEIFSISPKTLLFLILSGISTGGSWICYFYALKRGNVNVVVPIDKSSSVMAIILGIIVFSESCSPLKAGCIVAIALGTYLMIEKKESSSEKKSSSYIIYAFLGAILAALTSILGKIGVSDINSNLGTAIRTIVVLVMAWGIVFAQGTGHELKSIDKKSFVFIILSGFATGASWLCYYRALSTGEASVVVPIDKLSILLTIAFSYFFFHEKLSKKSIIGLFLIVSGTLLLLV
jgi:transporter family protein